MTRDAQTPDMTAVPDDPRLLEAVQAYMAELEAGRVPDRSAFVRSHPPDLQPMLAECLEGLELVHAAAGRDALIPVDKPNRKSGDGLPANPLGDFRIVREIGRGGMGVVYEATQLSLGRRVALKVLPFAATFDPKLLQRFHNEAQAAAHLHHTNIVPVYGVGCERGVHFYAMQFINGASLASLIRRLRLQAGRSAAEDHPPSRSISVAACEAAIDTASPFSHTLSEQCSGKKAAYFRTVANLMVQAAQALEHAHQVGIVHRDIKPANLLVDQAGQLWVTDFGLALFHADARLTRTGDLLGTVRYMSPEQASGQRILLDHRTDIYSLGATLYELVTLEPMFDGETSVEVIRQIVSDEPAAPRSLDRTIPVELETILLKAVNKNPADRYATIKDLAEDLRRFLDDRPILARRPTLIERGRKWARRHPSVVVATGLISLLCIAGLVVSNWRIAREEARTRAALGNEKVRAGEARRAVDLLVDVAEEELADNPQHQAVRRRLLETALTYYQNYIETQADDASAQAELEAGKKRVRSILDELATLQGLWRANLVNEEAIQVDLKLSASQRDALAKLRDRSTESRQRFFQEQHLLTSEARRQRFYEFAKTQETALDGILSVLQMSRLRQIELQLQGPRAFLESPVAQALKLTPEQKRKFREIREQFMGFMPFGPKGPPDGPPPPEGPPGKPPPKGPHGPDDFGKGPPPERALKEQVERILAELTPEQRGVWRELTGEPFEGVLRRPPPPFGPGPSGKGPPPKGGPREKF